jgi:FMN phosphatase YigB (HAD superfamily)
MNKPFALIVDFDNTLIDSSKYKQNLFLLAKDFGLSLKNANQAYIAVTKTNPFTVKRFSKMLFKKEIKTQKQFQLKAELIFTKPKQYNFLGVEKFLRSLQNKYELHLLTYGDKFHQLKKLRQSQLEKLFNSITVTTKVGKRYELAKFKIKLGKLIAVLDDSSEVCKIAQSLGLKSFQIRKGIKNEVYYNRLKVRINKYFT